MIVPFFKKKKNKYFLINFQNFMHNIYNAKTIQILYILAAFLSELFIQLFSRVELFSRSKKLNFYDFLKNIFYF